MITPQTPAEADELLDRWIDALASGRYQQAEGTLYRDRDGGVSHCCLGVLCEVAGAQRAEGAYLVDETAVYFAALPYGLTKAIGVDEVQLAGDNDRGDSFALIANRLRAGEYRAR